MFENVNPYDILGYGVIGLGFLLALLAYRLLTQEQKQDPRPSILKATYTFMAFSVILCIIGFAAQVYGNGDQQSSTAKIDEECREELDSLQANSITTANLSLINNAFFPNAITPAAAIDSIRRMARQSERVKQHQKSYVYRLFLLEKTIPEFGSNISLRVSSPGKTEAIKLIQKILRDLDYYGGPIDGAIKKAHDALIVFQKEYNARAGIEVFKPEKEFGVFGYRTLEALRSAYRRARS